MRSDHRRGWWVSQGFWIVAMTSLLWPPILLAESLTLPSGEAPAAPSVASMDGEGAEGGELAAEFDPLDLGDEFDLLAAEDVVVSATRHAQPIEESPSAITVLTRDMIRRSGANNLADLLRLVPGVDVFRSTAAQPAVGIRSNSTIAGDLILVLVDGRIALWPGLGQALWVAMPFDMQSVERVEVIRGPGSSIYGANALQGVVNVVTRRPGEKLLQSEMSLDVSEGDSLVLSSRVHGRKGKLGYWLSGGITRDAPLDDPATADLKVERARGYLSYDFGDRLTGTLELGAVHTSSSFYTVIGAGDWVNTSPYLVAKLEAPSSSLQLLLDQSSARATIDVALAVALAEGSPPLVLGTLPPFDVTARTAELQGSHWFSFSKRDRLTVGALLQAVWYQSNSLLNCPENQPVEGFDSGVCSLQNFAELSAGGFAQEEWRILDNLTLTGGLRLDLNTTQSKVAISPRLAFVYKPSDRHAFRLSAGRAIRKPTYLETYAHSRLEPGAGAPADLVERLSHIFATELGNPALDFESAISGEVGYRGRYFGDRLTLSVDLFVTQHSSAIFMQEDDLKIDSFAGVPFIAPEATLSYRNSEGSRIYGGGEVAALLKLGPRVELSLSYSLDRLLKDLSSNEPYSLEPEHRLIATMGFELGYGINLELDAFYASRYSDDIADPQSVLAPSTMVSLGAFPLVNSRIAWRGPSAFGELEMGLKVFNLLGYQERESAGVDLPAGGSFGGMRLDRRLTLFAEGRF